MVVGDGDEDDNEHESQEFDVNLYAFSIMRL
jgi:hypothetical protein